MRCVGGHNGEAVAAQTHIEQRCEGAKRRVEAKKKARRNGDAPSNKTFGNCLLGFDCSQKAPLETPQSPYSTPLRVANMKVINKISTRPCGLPVDWHAVRRFNAAKS